MQQTQIEEFHKNFPSSVVILKEQLRNQRKGEGFKVTENELDMLADNELWSFLTTAQRQDVDIAGVACVIEKASRADNIRNFGALVNSMLKKDWVHDRFPIGDGEVVVSESVPGSTVTNDFEEAEESVDPEPATASRGKRTARLEGMVTPQLSTRVGDLADTIGRKKGDLTGELIELGLRAFLKKVSRV